MNRSGPDLYKQNEKGTLLSVALNSNTFLRPSPANCIEELLPLILESFMVRSLSFGPSDAKVSKEKLGFRKDRLKLVEMGTHFRARGKTISYYGESLVYT